MRVLMAILNFLTFKTYRDRIEAAKRRKNYEGIKAEIVKRHLAGFGGLVLERRKYDGKDLAAFLPPMYFTARTANFEPVIFWRKDLMTEEVGPPDGPPPLKQSQAQAKAEVQAAVAGVIGERA